MDSQRPISEEATHVVHRDGIESYADTHRGIVLSFAVTKCACVTSLMLGCGCRQHYVNPILIVRSLS